MEFQPMSPEEMQRIVQFLLQQQAQFAVDLSQLEQKTDRIADGLIGLTSVVGQLAAAQLRTDEELREQRGHLREQREHLREQGEHLREQREHLREQGEHIDIIIRMFERHLRDDHGHRPS